MEQVTVYRLVSVAGYLTIGVVVICALISGGCSQKSEQAHWSAEDSTRIVNDNIAHRQSAESFFRDHPQSPFNQDSTAHYSGIKWFPIDIRYCYTSKLFRYPQPERVSILGTKGDERTYFKYGYFAIVAEDKEIQLTVYKDVSAMGNYLSVWFTDETTGKETYEVGRYVEVEQENPDQNYLYTIDFNKAYNPYCAYSARYSCAVPRQEDRLPFAVRAGEMKYHD